MTSCPRTKTATTSRWYVSGLFCAANYSCVRCACVDDLDETDDFDRLRAYAVSRLGAPPDSDDEGEASGCVTRVVSEPVDEQEFAQVFRRVLERRGWPVAKYGRGKALRSCLKVFAEDGALRLEWGSRKSNDAARSVLLTEIVDISRVIFTARRTRRWMRTPRWHLVKTRRNAGIPPL